MGCDDTKGFRVEVAVTPLVILGLASLAFGIALGYLVGAMVLQGGYSPAITRKVFHFAVFSGAVPTFLLLGFWGTVTYGSVLSLVILVAIRQGPASPLFRALSRPSQEPVARTAILTPLLATAVGGLLSVLLVGGFSVVGFLVCGWGDGIGEPVGGRWGKHRYRPPFGGDPQRTRSVEGSLGVFVAGSVGGAVALLLLGFGGLQALGFGLACGLCGAAVEGLSAPLTDNLWVQLAPSLLAWWLLG